MNITPANGNRPWERTLCPLCPRCMQIRKTCEHILFCNHTGRVEALQQSIHLLDKWMKETGTDTILRESITEYALGRGGQLMSSITWGLPLRYRLMAQSVDKIGRRRFMEGMIPKEIRKIQETFVLVEGASTSPVTWSTGIIVKLLEVVHGQWLYRCVQIHDKTRGPKKRNCNAKLRSKWKKVGRTYLRRTNTLRK